MPGRALLAPAHHLGIDAQGLGGLTTVLDVKIMDYPTHAASLPVCMIPNCAVTRHAHCVLDGSGPAFLEPPSLDLWPDVHWAPDYNKSKQVDLNTLTKEEVASWKPGQTLLLNGKMLTGRDAAHKRIQDMLAKGEPLPVDFTNRVIYYVGPVDPVRDEVVGPVAVSEAVTAQARAAIAASGWRQTRKAMLDTATPLHPPMPSQAAGT